MVSSTPSTVDFQAQQAELRAQQDKKKADEALKRSKEKLSRSRSYGSDTSRLFVADNYIAGDTTLASGSLLSLGDKLGQ